MNLVDWLKKMVSNRNPEGVLDPKLPEKPTSRALKRALLVALRCTDPNAQKRPKMGHVIHMLEAEDSPYKEVTIISAQVNPTSVWPWLMNEEHSFINLGGGGDNLICDS